MGDVKIDVLGVRFDAFTMESALDRAKAWLCDPKPRFAVTPNAEITFAAQKDASLRDTLNAADMVLADGVGVVKAAKRLGRPLPGRLPGVEFAQALLAVMEEKGKSLYLLGGKPGVARAAADRVKGTHPALRVSGVRDGYYEDESAVTRHIRECAPDVIFVCLGAPKQEMWMGRNLENVGPALMLGLGGTVDILAGKTKRAPAIFRRLGLEWLYRVAFHPSRWARAMKLPRFMLAVRRQRRRAKNGV
ncbi:MAG: WecB/TagA/CpsF family glycosyltransferase [Oscillospiraceae bacterium]|jgi:N-acetylglucosaminyldiphosphoundecaprenol N-acetyl-beta-D-mannosaminyltransferase|nr:WecB/TagA/CpsF family glycosyltransferase [Oscillospiraceae bacterium]